MNETAAPLFDKDKRYEGKIHHINKEEGWGYVITKDIRFRKIYFHWTALNSNVLFENLSKGLTMEFNVIDYLDQGLRAIKIGVKDGRLDNKVQV